jgi:CDP-paratose 2-epimerase
LSNKRKILITGGAGFIGVNSAVHFSNDGWQVTVLDNLSRPGAENNLKWLETKIKFEFVKADIRHESVINDVLKVTQPDAILHLAAQVAVTTSVVNPREDFEINALGTFNMLEAVRVYCPDCFFINASTNKVYGKMENDPVVEKEKRFEYRDIDGVKENQILDFHSPYGCSKGAADQYAMDYARIFNLRTVNLRQSCIYGQRQLGVEDQGWVAWFTIATLFQKPITIYGNGKQIRDILHVDDLTRCYAACIERSDSVSGQAFNVGGGPGNT